MIQFRCGDSHNEKTMGLLDFDYYRRALQSRETLKPVEHRSWENSKAQGKVDVVGVVCFRRLSQMFACLHRM